MIIKNSLFFVYLALASLLYSSDWQFKGVVNVHYTNVPEHLQDHSTQEFVYLNHLYYQEDDKGELFLTIGFQDENGAISDRYRVVSQLPIELESVNFDSYGAVVQSLGQPTIPSILGGTVDDSFGYDMVFWKLATFEESFQKITLYRIGISRKFRRHEPNKIEVESFEVHTGVAHLINAPASPQTEPNDDESNP